MLNIDVGAASPLDGKSRGRSVCRSNIDGGEPATDAAVAAAVAAEDAEYIAGNVKFSLCATRIVGATGAVPMDCVPTRTPLVLPTLFRLTMALLPAASRRLPPFISIAPPRLIPLASSWPFATVKRKTSAPLPEPLR